jgi:hypothetical protein
VSAPSAPEPRTIARHRSTGAARRYPMIVGLLVTLASVPTLAAVLAGSASLTTASQPRTPFVADAPQDSVVVPGVGETSAPSVGIARPQSTRVPVAVNRTLRGEDLPIRVVREARSVQVPEAVPGPGAVSVPAGTTSPVPTSPRPESTPEPTSSPAPTASPSASAAASPAGSPSPSPTGSRESGNGGVGLIGVVGGLVGSILGHRARSGR